MIASMLDHTFVTKIYSTSFSYITPPIVTTWKMTNHITPLPHAEFELVMVHTHATQ